MESDFNDVTTFLYNRIPMLGMCMARILKYILPWQHNYANNRSSLTCDMAAELTALGGSPQVWCPGEWPHPLWLVLVKPSHIPTQTRSSTRGNLVPLSRACTGFQGLVHRLYLSHDTPWGCGGVSAAAGLAPWRCHSCMKHSSSMLPQLGLTLLSALQLP